MDGMLKSEINAGMKLCKFTFTIISSLPCLHTFFHISLQLYHPYLVCILLSMPSLHLFTFLKSCFCTFLMLTSVTVTPGVYILKSCFCTFLMSTSVTVTPGVTATQVLGL